MDKKVDLLWIKIQELDSDAYLFSFWENRKDWIIKVVSSADSNFETVICILYRLSKLLNDKEEYASVYYLYKFGYLPIEMKLTNSTSLNELKFEFGRGLVHNRKYEHSKSLFNELHSINYDNDRISDWRRQSIIKSDLDKYWFKTYFLPRFGVLILTIAF